MQKKESKKELIGWQDLPNRKGDLTYYNLTLFKDVIVCELTNKRIRFYINGKIYWSKKSHYWSFWNSTFDSVPIYETKGPGRSPERIGEITLNDDKVVINGQRQIDSGLFYSFVSPYTDFKGDCLYIRKPAKQ